MTFSVHKYAPGFFPGSGKLENTGYGKGKYYTVNIPLMDGVRDSDFIPVVCRLLQKVRDVYKPEAVVCQCGADGLAGDPTESFNLTHLALGRCVYFILSWGLKTLLLGGGGYHHANTARCWTFLTALAVNKQLPPDIPDNQFFMEYGPDYDLAVSPGNRKDLNSKSYLKEVYTKVLRNLNQIS